MYWFEQKISWNSFLCIRINRKNHDWSSSRTTTTCCSSIKKSCRRLFNTSEMNSWLREVEKVTDCLSSVNLNRRPIGAINYSRWIVVCFLPPVVFIDFPLWSFIRWIDSAEDLLLVAKCFMSNGDYNRTRILLENSSMYHVGILLFLKEEK